MSEPTPPEGQVWRWELVGGCDPYLVRVPSPNEAPKRYKFGVTPWAAISRSECNADTCRMHDGQKAIASDFELIAALEEGDRRPLLLQELQRRSADWRSDGIKDWARRGKKLLQQVLREMSLPE